MDKKWPFFLLEVSKSSVSKRVRAVLNVHVGVHSQTEGNKVIPLVKSKCQSLGMWFQNLDQKSNGVEVNAFRSS